MRRILSMLAVVFTLGLSSVALEAEAAKRLGSGKSVGTQRQVAPDKPSAAAAQAPTAGTAAAAGAAAPAAGRSWMAPVAGLAAGLGLAALASHFGFGDELASLVMMGLLAAAVMVVIGLVMRKRAGMAQGSAAGGGPLAYAGAGYATGAGTASGLPPATSASDTAVWKRMADAPAQASGVSLIGSSLAPPAATGVRIPAGFDVAAFERHASDNFVRLQAANDAGDLQEIGRFTTPELLATLREELAERGGAAQKTEVLEVSAQVLDVDESSDPYVVSVRLSGRLRDALSGEEEPFAEVWHLSKPRTGGSGWLLAGIQQPQ